MDKWAQRIQAFAMVVLVIITAIYVQHTHSLAVTSRQQAEEMRKQAEIQMGINRPNLTLNLTGKEYATFPLSFEQEPWEPRWVIPSALTVSICNEGEGDALGLQTYVIGKSYAPLEYPAIPGVPSTPRYYYWSAERFEPDRLSVGEEIEITFNYTLQLIFIEEPDKIYASYVPFEFAVVAVCEDDFRRVWLSALELKWKLDLEQNTYQVEEGELRVFKLPPRGQHEVETGS